jgi:hypothetical protein
MILNNLNGVFNEKGEHFNPKTSIEFTDDGRANRTTLVMNDRLVGLIQTDRKQEQEMTTIAGDDEGGDIAIAISMKQDQPTAIDVTDDEDDEDDIAITMNRKQSARSSLSLSDESLSSSDSLSSDASTSGSEDGDAAVLMQALQGADSSMQRRSTSSLRCDLGDASSDAGRVSDGDLESMSSFHSADGDVSTIF